MTEPQDEVTPAAGAKMRTAMAAAAQVAQRVMRALEQRQREVQAASEQRSAELRARFDAERSAARAVAAPLGRDDLWATAQPEQIASAYETAHAWERFDPDARAAADRIRDEVGVRYGVDPTSLDRAAQIRRDAADEQSEARLDEAAALATVVDVAADVSERGEADTEYQVARRQREDALRDSAERRTDTARSLEGKASREAVNERMGIDKGQGKPARDAVAGAPKKATGTRKTQVTGIGIGIGIGQQDARRPHM